MNKRLILVTCILLLAASISYAQPRPKIDLAKKIADATPAELPQSPVPTSVSSDARDTGLKGKVNSILEFSLPAGRRLREPTKESFFTESGNWIKRVHYDEGYPSIVVVFGYIDGMRVSLSREVQYASGERPESSDIILLGRTEDSEGIPESGRDTRYGMKTILKYDGHGRLIESNEYQNNGDLWNRAIIEYEKNRRIERNFDANGDEMSNTTEVFDAAGNAIERQEGPDKYVLKHEFDLQGNWIVERTYEEKTVKRKKVLKLLWTTYRTITYYP